MDPTGVWAVDDVDKSKTLFQISADVLDQTFTFSQARGIHQHNAFLKIKKRKMGIATKRMYY
jgi:hypothetical protein